MGTKTIPAVSRKKINVSILNSRYGGDYQGRDDYDDWGGYWLPELIVTPDGSWWEDSEGNRIPEDDYDNYGYEGGNGNGGHGSSDSDAEMESMGRQAYQHIVDSVNNQTAHICSITDSNTYKTLNTAAFIAQCPEWQNDLVKALTNEDLWGKLGKSFCKAASWGSAICTYIAIYEKIDNGEDLSTWDYCQIIASLFGAVAAPMTAGAVPLILGSTSIILSIIGTAGESYENSSNY